MKTIHALCLNLVCLLTFAHPVQSEEWKAEEGYTSLSNGQDLTGWHYKGEADLEGKSEAADGRYAVKDGTIIVNPYDESKGPKLRQLWTIKEFPTDFILKVEFRAAVNADSGVFVRGPQLQCRDYLVAGPYKELKNYKPQEWNQLEIVVKGQTACCTCNGEVLEAALKLPATGPIGLEADRGQMEYRHLQLKELK